MKQATTDQKKPNDLFDSKSPSYKIKSKPTKATTDAKKRARERQALPFGQSVQVREEANNELRTSQFLLNPQVKSKLNSEAQSQNSGIGKKDLFEGGSDDEDPEDFEAFLESQVRMSINSDVSPDKMWNQDVIDMVREDLSIRSSSDSSKSS